MSLFQGYDDKFKDMSELKDHTFSLGMDYDDKFKEVKKAIDKSDITISFKEYHELKKASHLLQCLEDAGVDNWSGYEIAIDQHMEVYNEY